GRAARRRRRPRPGPALLSRRFRTQHGCGRRPSSACCSTSRPSEGPESQGGHMAGPFIYIGTNTIKEGKVEECRKMLNEIAQLVERKEQRVIAFNFYLDEPNR